MRIDRCPDGNPTGPCDQCRRDGDDHGGPNTGSRSTHCDKKYTNLAAKIYTPNKRNHRRGRFNRGSIMIMRSGEPGIYCGDQVNVVIRPKLLKDVGFSVSDKKSRKEVFRFSGGFPGRMEWSGGVPNVARDAAERLALIEMSTEFHPSSESENLAETQGTVKQIDPRSIDESWANWFTMITKDADLLPDTNILLKRTLTQIILRQLRERRQHFKIAIPRLAILELERLANEGQRASKGECFMAFKEIRSLKKEERATLTMPLEPILMSSFSAIAGRQLTDAFLRDEVRRWAETVGVKRVIFLTRDMVSALAANSEDLDAI